MSLCKKNSGFFLINRKYKRIAFVWEIVIFCEFLWRIYNVFWNSVFVWKLTVYNIASGGNASMYYQDKIILIFLS